MKSKKQLREDIKALKKSIRHWKNNIKNLGRVDWKWWGALLNQERDDACTFFRRIPMPKIYGKSCPCCQLAAARMLKHNVFGMIACDYCPYAEHSGEPANKIGACSKQWRDCKAAFLVDGDEERSRSAFKSMLNSLDFALYNARKERKRRAEGCTTFF